MLCRKSDHHLNALQRVNRTKRPTAQTRYPGQWLVPRASRGDTVGRSSNGRLSYLKFSTGVVEVVRVILSVAQVASWACDPVTTPDEFRAARPMVMYASYTL